MVEPAASLGATHSSSGRSSSSFEEDTSDHLNSDPRGTEGTEPSVLWTLALSRAHPHPVRVQCSCSFSVWPGCELTLVLLVLAEKVAEARKQQLVEYEKSELCFHLLTCSADEPLNSRLGCSAVVKEYYLKAQDFRTKLTWLTPRDWSLLLWEEPHLAALVDQFHLGAAVIFFAACTVSTGLHLS